MDVFEIIGYTCLALLAAIYAGAMLFGMINAGFMGVIGLIFLVGIGALFVKVLSERLSNREDDHYSKNVER